MEGGSVVNAHPDFVKSYGGRNLDDRLGYWIICLELYLGGKVCATVRIRFD
jgi:hypothetical protein